MCGIYVIDVYKRQDEIPGGNKGIHRVVCEEQSWNIYRRTRRACLLYTSKASAHGEPLGEENVLAMKENLGWPSMEPFYIPDEVYEHYAHLAEEKAETEAAWNVMFAAYYEEYPEMEALWNACLLYTSILAGGIVMFNNYERMQEMESVIASAIPERVESALMGKDNACLLYTSRCV